jgi:hypothetical protein
MNAAHCYAIVVFGHAGTIRADGFHLGNHFSAIRNWIVTELLQIGAGLESCDSIRRSKPSRNVTDGGRIAFTKSGIRTDIRRSKLAPGERIKCCGTFLLQDGCSITICGLSDRHCPEKEQDQYSINRPDFMLFVIRAVIGSVCP